MLTLYISPLLSMVSLSVVFVTHGQPWSKYEKWNIAEINNLYVFASVLFWVG